MNVDEVFSHVTKLLEHKSDYAWSVRNMFMS